MENKLNDVIWYPFTQMKTAKAPIHIESAKDALLFSKDGKEYIDAISSWWVNIHGHANPIIAKAISDQANKLEQVIFAGFTHSPALDLAKGLINVLPNNFAKVFFSDNGSTSVEVALKLALQYWHNKGFKQKTNIIAFENSYHGDTFGAMSIGAKNEFNAAFEQLLFKVDFLPVPNAQNLETVKQQLKTIAAQGTTAAFIFEPLVQGASGMLMHKAEHLNELLKIAHDNQILTIADEVMTGFGRTGKNFAIEHLSEKPDIICLSKGITGGFMPLGVTVSSQKIFDAFYSTEVAKTFFHGHSYTANPLACSAANASLKLLTDPSCQKQIQEITQQHALFAERIHSNPLVKEVRQTGTILAIELITSEKTSYFNSIGNKVNDFCLEKGVYLRPLGNIVYIMPPYCITESQLNKVYNTLFELLTSLELPHGKPDQQNSN